MNDDGYPSWLPHRPPPPGPHSTVQSSIREDDSPQDDVGGRKPTLRSVRIVNLEPRDHTAAPPRTRATGPPPTIPLPQPRFNAKNLQIELLRSPDWWMKAYFYIWPLLVFYHIPLQSFFDFNAVYVLLQVTKYPSPDSSSKSWALATTAYIACWLVWILIVFLTYEIIYSFARRWRLRRPLILPIYLSSPAFNMAALSSYTTFSFLQHIRLSALSHEHAYSNIQDEKPADPDSHTASQFLAETCYFYSQNLPTVGLLLPRAGLCLSLLLSFATPTPSLNPIRDATFFNTDGTLTDYAKGVLLANAAWTAWRTLVLLLSWLGLWLFSSNRLAGICGPRHIWEEHSQEKTRSVYSAAASEHGARNSWLYHHPTSTDQRPTAVYHEAAAAYHHPHRSYADGYEPGPYAGDELPWEWREHTRMRVQDAFEFCLALDNHRRPRQSDPLVWGTSRRSKGKERSSTDGDERPKGFEGIEKVLAAIGFGPSPPSSPSGAKRGALTRDLFDTPEPELEERAGPSSAVLLPLKTPKAAKRNSRDKDTIQHDLSLLSVPPPLVPEPTSVLPGAPLSSLPYPFTQPGVGRVSSRDNGLVPFPAVDGAGERPQSRGSRSTSSGTTGSGTGPGTGEGDDDDDDEDEEEEEDEDESQPRGSESMSSLGHPISPSRGHPLLSATRARAHGRGHTRNPSGVSRSSGGGPRTQGRRSTSSGATGTGTGTTGSFSGGAYSYRYSAASGGSASGRAAVAAVPVVVDEDQASAKSRSTGNRSTSESERGAPSVSSGGGIPMPPRHPNLEGSQGQGRTRKMAISAPASSKSSARSGSVVSRASPPVVDRRRADSGPVIVGIGYDVERRYEDHAGGEGGGAAEDDLVGGEREDRLGLLVVPSPRASMVSVGNGTGGRSRADSLQSSTSTSTSSARSRSRTHSSRSNASPSVRERASSAGHSVRSLVVAAVAAVAGSGLGRSRVNSTMSMARLEEEEVGEFGERERARGGEGCPSASSRSRSGSESAENYTFGRPVAFMRSSSAAAAAEGAVSRNQGRVEEEEGDVVLVRAAAAGADVARDNKEEEQSESGRLRGGIDIPVRHRVLQHQQHQHQQQSLPTTTTTVSGSNGSHADISTAPASFVTAPSFFEGGSSASVLLRDRLGEEMGAGSPWRIA